MWNAGGVVVVGRIRVGWGVGGGGLWMRAGRVVFMVAAAAAVVVMDSWYSVHTSGYVSVDARIDSLKMSRCGNNEREGF